MGGSPSADRLDAYAVLLAAGRSSRMGHPKGLVTVDGRAWIEHQLDAAASVVRGAIVVLGHDRDRYLAAVPRLADRALVVVNEDPERGPFSSLQCGLAHVARLGNVGAGAFVLPVDVPAASPQVWTALSSALAGEAAGPRVDAAVPVYDGRGGHPVLLSSSFVARLLTLASSARLDEALRSPGVRVSRVPVADSRVRLNLNEPGDWGTLKGG